MRKSAWKLAIGIAIIALTACGGAPAATAPTTVSVPTSASAPTAGPPTATAPTAAPPPTAATAVANALVGTWERVNSCKSFVQAFKDAGLIDLAPDWLVGGGYFSSADKIDKTDLCKGANEVKHSHFFTAAGGFGSRDETGTQVDDGHYTAVDDHTIAFDNKMKIQYTVDGDTVMFTVVPPTACTGGCRQDYAWANAAFYPGPFQRVQQASATVAPAATSAPLADTNPEKPNDTTQGRLRITNCIQGGPGVDMLINRKLTVNGGVTQANVGERKTGGYQYLTPGTYSIAIVPNGEGIDKALLGPLDVTIAAGHRYTLALLGQRDDAKGTPLLIDETAAYQEIGADPRGVAHITINNVKGAPGLDQLQDDIVRDKNAPYGGFAAGIWPVGPIKGFALTISGARDKVLVNVPAPGFNTPGVDYLDCIAGRYPGTFEQDYNGDSSASTSQLSLLAFLQLQNEVGAKYPGKASTFNTFLSALKTTRMEDELAKGGPYLILPPTDAAFAALPKDKLDALLADPKALADLLRAHIVETYAPTGSLGRTFTTMHGEQIKVGFNDYKLVVNDELIGPTLSAFVANGTRVVSAEKLLLDVK